jgi:anti-sigma-K factor RskA
MNDFSELEKELRKLRPAQPSPVLFEQVGRALNESRAGSKEQRSPIRVWGGLEATRNWWSLGFGLAAAAVLVLFAAVTMERRQEHQQTIAQSSPAPQTRAVPFVTEPSTRRGRFVPAGGSNLVYNTRDEGLHFADGSERPVRRVRYNTQQTWRWRNPETGASLRVSYPSEEVVLIPVSGQ